MDRIPSVSTIVDSTLLLAKCVYSIWGVADGSRIASVDSEIISYAVLDVLAKPVFGMWLLFTHDSMSSRYVYFTSFPYDRLLIICSSVSLGGFWSEGLSKEGSLRVGDDDEGA